jgi:hypothetical protein
MRKLKYFGTGLYRHNQVDETEKGICFRSTKDGLDYWFPKAHIRVEKSMFGLEIMRPDWMKVPPGRMPKHIDYKAAKRRTR